MPHSRYKLLQSLREGQLFWFLVRVEVRVYQLEHLIERCVGLDTDLGFCYSIRMLTQDYVSHIFYLMEQGHLRAEPRIALNGVGHAVVLVHDEVVREDAVEGELF